MMMTNPITPPPELVEQWRAAASNVPATLSTDPGGRRDYIDFIATQATRWGADQELEAMLAELKALHLPDGYAARLRAARRPKPPSLEEQALLVIDTAVNDYRMSSDAASIIRRALEALND